MTRKISFNELKIQIINAGIQREQDFDKIGYLDINGLLITNNKCEQGLTAIDPFSFGNNGYILCDYKDTTQPDYLGHYTCNKEGFKGLHINILEIKNMVFCVKLPPPLYDSDHFLV